MAPGFSGWRCWVALVVLLAAAGVLFEPVSAEDPRGMQKRLRKVFDEALEEDPGFELPPELQWLEGSTREEKSKALVEWALTQAGEKLEQWLGESSIYLRDIKRALTEKNKVSRAKAVQSALSNLFDKLLARLSRRGQTCKEAIAQGIHPEVRLGHAPLKTFGYPVLAQGVTVLNRRLPLNRINGFPIPVTVGAQDYVVQGRVKTVMSFFECFAEYEVKAETLFQDGHWGMEDKGSEKARPLYLQVQGVMEGGSVSQILTRAALHRVVKSMDFKLNKKGSLVALVDAALRGDLLADDFLQSSGGGLPLIGDLAAYTNLAGGNLVDLVKEMNEAGSFKEKFEIFMRYMKGPEDDPDGWSNRKAVHRQERITVILTSYPKPNSTVRATYKMPTNKVSLQQIKEALEEINFKQ
ncbi:hypothetical protein Emed_006792 [Eimeria media]